MAQPQWLCGGWEFLAFLPLSVPIDRIFSVLNYKPDSIPIKKNQDGNLMLEHSVCYDWVDLEKALMLVSFHLTKASDFWTKIERSWLMPTRLPVYEEERFYPVQFTLFFTSHYCYDQLFFRHKDEMLVKKHLYCAWQGFRPLTTLVTFLIY